VTIYQPPRIAALRASAIAAVTDALIAADGLRPEQIGGLDAASHG
jgi:hypothetical protein